MPLIGWRLAIATPFHRPSPWCASSYPAWRTSVPSRVERRPATSIRRIPKGPHTNLELVIHGRAAPGSGTERERGVEKLAESHEVLQAARCGTIEAISGVEPLDVAAGKPEAPMADGHARDVPEGRSEAAEIEVDQNDAAGRHDHVRRVSVDENRWV